MAESMMPRTLTLVRHGESESNAAKRAAEKGKRHPRERDLMRVHTSQRRLTPRGIQQAHDAGTWLRQHFQNEAKRFGGVPYSQVCGYFSPYARAMETAGHLGLPIQWRPDARLSERNWGDLDQLTYEERIAKYGEIDNLRELHGMYWPAANGETLQALSTRMWQHFHMLREDRQGADVVDVSHGETILTQRFMLERWLPEDIVKMMLRTDSKLSKEMLKEPMDRQNKIINCRIIQYTRENEGGGWGTKYCRVRLIAPSAPDDPNKNLDWRPIERRQFTSQELLEYVDQFPHFLSAA